MTKKPRANVNVAASVRRRLLNQSRLGGGQDFQRLLVRYAIERLLYRLSQSASRSKFVLKGANLFAIWAKTPFRSTGDLDFLGVGPSEVEAARKTFADICKTKVADDGLVFDPASIRVETTREEEEYQGLRVRLTAALGTAVIAVQVDIGFGDTVHPEPLELVYPPILDDMPAAKIRAYPPETVIAEKFEAMIRFGELTSRLKDHYDLWVISRTFPFDMDVLTNAIANTFKNRGTEIPTTMPAPLTSAFAADRVKQAQWAAFLTRTAPTFAPPPFSDVVEDVRLFLGPVLTALAAKSTAAGHWIPGGGWTE
jgi:predicted nucleotidyltransferase component of viral defense system